MTHHTFATTAIWSTEDDGNVEQEVTVTYTYHKGWAGDRTDPPEPASVEIQSVVPDVPDEVYDALVEECFEDYSGYLSDAAEYRAESRRDGW